MGTTVGKDDLIAALRLRYDYYSAQTVFDGALDVAGLAKQPAYNATEVAAMKAALSRVGDRLEMVEARIDALLGSQAAPPPSQPQVQPPPVARVSEPEPKPVETPPPAPPAPATSTVPTSAAVVATTISLVGLEPAEGERVLVCGSVDALGAWDPERAVAMVRAGDAWVASVVIPPGTEGEFKFLRRTADGPITWESGANRELTGAGRLEATWRPPAAVVD